MCQMCVENFMVSLATLCLLWPNTQMKSQHCTWSKHKLTVYLPCCMVVRLGRYQTQIYIKLAATLRWFTAGGAIRIAVRQLSQTWKLRHYDVMDNVITRKL